MVFRRMTATNALSHNWITEQRSNRLARTANSRFITRTNSGKRNRYLVNFMQLYKQLLVDRLSVISKIIMETLESNESSKHSNESKSLTSQNRRVRARELDELLAMYNNGKL